ncbi:transmembrane 220 family protein [Cellvibrio mixtus]|uniref:transmembrane 220 family protein n=1 Tax=Cellvibrio mixtus TaxID=39650 RepID=UPI0006948441|nr:transmembrane 220 family protein [Cellvibrio mixtus]
MPALFTRIIHSIFALTLIAFAYLQLNDPDPLVWTTFYLICAVVPLLELVNRRNRYVFWIAVSLCIIDLGIYTHGAYTYYLHSNEEALMQSMNPDKPYIEEAREFLGTLIALTMISISYWLGRKAKHR